MTVLMDDVCFDYSRVFFDHYEILYGVSNQPEGMSTYDTETAAHTSAKLFAENGKSAQVVHVISITHIINSAWYPARPQKLKLVAACRERGLDVACDEPKQCREHGCIRECILSYDLPCEVMT